MLKVTNWLPVGLPVLTALLSLPLALRLIGPNPVYGYRTSTSMASPELWYKANAYAGWLGFAFSIVAFVINLYLLRSSSVNPEQRRFIAVVVFAALMLVCGGIQYYINR